MVTAVVIYRALINGKIATGLLVYDGADSDRNLDGSCGKNFFGYYWIRSGYSYIHAALYKKEDPESIGVFLKHLSWKDYGCELELGELELSSLCELSVLELVLCELELSVLELFELELGELELLELEFVCELELL